MPKSTRNVLRIDPASPGPVYFAIISTGAIVMVSFILSFAALSTLSGWMALPVFLGPLLPIFIDGAIIVYTYAAIAARAEGERTWRPWLWVALWTSVSSAANGAHAWFNGPQGYEGLAGAILAGLIPVGSLLGTHEIADRIITRPGRDHADGVHQPVSNPTRTRASKASKRPAPKRLTGVQPGASKPRALTPALDTPSTSKTSSTVSSQVSSQVSSTESPGVSNVDSVDTGDLSILDGVDLSSLDGLDRSGVQSDVSSPAKMDKAEQDRRIIKLDSDNVPKADIARIVGVSRQTVYNVLSKVDTP